MTTEQSKLEFLVLSRGKWDKDKTPEQIQDAIDRFYVWYERNVAEGRMKRGSRLGIEAKLVSKHGVTDGPFAEAKEVVGGYWFIVANSLAEAAALAAENPCASCGLLYEVRPLEAERASARKVASETPVEFR